jgi:hypothetical protein
VIKLIRIRWVGHVAGVGESRGAYMVLVERPEGTGQVGRPRHSWVDNIEMNYQEVGWGHRLD